MFNQVFKTQPLNLPLLLPLSQGLRVFAEMIKWGNGFISVKWGSNVVCSILSIPASQRRKS